MSLPEPARRPVPEAPGGVKTGDSGVVLRPGLTESAAARLGFDMGRTAEFLLVVAIVTGIFLLNMVTAELYPAGSWVDEVYFGDPAINLARGNGLTSSVWGHSYWGQFWVSYPPLYSLLLAGWTYLFGVHLGTMRLLNYALISGAALILWRYTVRSELFPRPGGRLLVVLLILLGYSASFVYRSIRPDTLGILLAVIALYASTLGEWRWRTAILLLAGALLPWTSLSLPACAGILAFLVGLWWFAHAVRLFLPLVIGIGLGTLVLLGMYAAQGSLYGFFLATFGSSATILGQVLRLIVQNNQQSWDRFIDFRSLLMAAVFIDRSAVFMGAAAVLMLVSLRRTAQTVAISASRFAVVTAFALPVLMQAVGGYKLYYAWMGYLAVGIAVVIALGASARDTGFVPARRLACGCIAVALAIGLPLQLALAYGDRDARDYDAVRAYVAARVSPGDWVYVTQTSYYAAAELGAVPVLNDYAWGSLARGIPDDQRRRIKSIIVSPEEAKAALDRLGGSWRPDGPAFDPPPLHRLTWGEFDNGLALEAYREE